MGNRLRQEIKQTKPFGSLEQEVLLNLVRSADYVMRAHEDTLKGYGLSPEQYNVLRILRGAGESGLPCNEIGARMITRAPDITRMLDRLEAAELITRQRSVEDRRVVNTCIAPQGLELLTKLDQPVIESARGIFAHMNRTDLKLVNELLEEMRAGAAPQ